MQLLKNTRAGNRSSFLGLLTKVILILLIIIIVIVLIGKIDFPSPNKEIRKIIPNEKIKIVK